MSLTIYVCTHKKAYIPEDSIYVPLHVGRATSEDLEYIGDDTGDNISAENNHFGELTGLYWIWKNSPETGWIGMCHYRRYFLSDQGEILSKDEYEKLLADCDVMVSEEMNAGKPYLSYYNEAHDKRQQELVREAISVLFADDLDAYDAVMAQSKYYYGNLCVMKRERLNKYCEWLFAILFYVKERLDISSYDAYHARVYGFLSEQLLRVWLKKEQLNIRTMPIGITSEKAETEELKRAVGQLIKMNSITEARTLFSQVLAVRPDVALELSDIKKELPIIECILYILELEEKNGITDGMRSYSAELSVLIAHYRKLSQMLMDQREDTEGGRSYLASTHTSEYAMEVVRRNTMP